VGGTVLIDHKKEKTPERRSTFVNGKHMKRIIFIILLLLLTLSVFAGCASGKKAERTPEKTGDEQITSETDTASTEEKTESPAPVTKYTSQYEAASRETTKQSNSEPSASTTEPPAESKPEETEVKPKMKTLTMKIGSTNVDVDWEENESVAALTELVKDKPITIQMSMYGGFEQVGPLGTSLPKNDIQTTTSPGDIVLYSGNQIVVFYGSNSWAYTRLGKITGKTAAEMTELLGNGNITITIS